MYHVKSVITFIAVISLWSSTKLHRMTLLRALFLTPPQELARIAEANELFDAVLTGSVDRDKKVATNVAPPHIKETPVRVEKKQTVVKTQRPAHLQRRLSLYIGSFPWVSILLLS